MTCACFRRLLCVSFSRQGVVVGAAPSLPTAFVCCVRCCDALARRFYNCPGGLPSARVWCGEAPPRPCGWRAAADATSGPGTAQPLPRGAPTPGSAHCRPRVPAPATVPGREEGHVLWVLGLSFCVCMCLCLCMCVYDASVLCAHCGTAPHTHVFPHSHAAMLEYLASADAFPETLAAFRRESGVDDAAVAGGACA